MTTVKNQVQIDVNVNTGELSSSLSQLKKELAELKKIDLDILPADKQRQVVNRMGEIKGKIDDLNYSLKIDPGDKWGNIGTALRHVATGFAAITAAQTVFGSENKKLQELQKQFNALISVSMLLQELSDSGRLKSVYLYYYAKIKELTLSKIIQREKEKEIAANVVEAAVVSKVSVAKRIATTAQWLWNAAMNASPIMLIVTAVLAFGSAIYMLTKTMMDNNKLTAASVKLSKELADSYKERVQGTRDLYLELNVLNGKMTEQEAEIVKISDWATKERKKTLEKYAKERKNLNEKQFKDFKEYGKALQKLTKAEADEIAEIKKQAYAKLDILAKKTNDKQKEKDKKDAAEATAAAKARTEKQRAEVSKQLGIVTKANEERLKKQTEFAKAYLDLVEKADKEREDMLAKSFAKRKEYSDKNKELDEKEKERIDKLYLESYTDAVDFYSKMGTVGQSFSILDNLLTNKDGTGLLQKITEISPEIQAGIESLSVTIAQGLEGLLQETLSNETQTQIAALYAEIDNFSNVQNKSLQNLRDRNIITEAEYNRRKEALDKEVERKQKAAKKKAFELEKEEKIKLITIQTALAVISAIAKTPETFGLPFSAFAAAQGIIQAGFVKAQKPPQYAKGTLFTDETFYRNGIVGEAGPEALMSNRATEKYFNLLSSLNTSVGGNNFGGNNNVNELNIMNAQLQQLIDLTSKQKIVIPVQSLNQVQKDLSRIEAYATLT